jgi:hypothetical protein
VPHYFIYMWRHGVQCHGVDGRPGESCIWRGVMAYPVSVQERLRGWRCRGRLFGRRPYIGSRVRLTGGHEAHNSQRGGVLSPRPPTVLGMVMQCPGWCWDGGDGRTEPMATEVTGPAGLTSRRSTVRAWSSRPSSLRGRGTSVIREWAAQCHRAVAGHAAQRRTVAGWPHRGSWRNSVGA